MTGGVPTLVLSDVSVRIGHVAVVTEVSSSLHGGELVALVGPNGAGKTTLLKAIAGLLEADGTVSLHGTPTCDLRPADLARRMAYLPQGHQAFWPLTAREIVALGRFAHGAHDPARLSDDDRDRVDAAMSRAECLAFADQSILTLSGGERARVMLARVLAAEAQVLLVDEPTAALDPRHQVAVMRVLRAEADRGALVLAVTHDLTLAARFADRVLMMAKGTLVADGPPATVLDSTRLAAHYGVASRSVTIDGQTLTLPWVPL